jgi:hypothetical protein
MYPINCFTDCVEIPLEAATRKFQVVPSFRYVVGFEVLTAMVMKDSILWYITLWL